MTAFDQRWHQLMSEPDDDKAILTRDEMVEGWHWCWDFDGLLVGPSMPNEWHICNCGWHEYWVKMLKPTPTRPA